jgi:hypothetical protein
MNHTTLPKLAARVLTLLAASVVTSGQAFPQSAAKPTQPVGRNSVRARRSSWPSSGSVDLCGC